MNKKLKKLIRNPNLFFFDYFSKKLGKTVENKHVTGQCILGYEILIDEKIHPWIQVAKRFGLRTGAMTGLSDQSLLVDRRRLVYVLFFVLHIAQSFKCMLRIYTLAGGLDITLKESELLVPGKAEWIYSKISQKPDFVIELVGQFDNNFACHIFLYEIDSNGLVNIRSNSAYIKKFPESAFDSIYPAARDVSGDYGFDTPWPIDVVFTWVNKDDPTWVDKWIATYPQKNFDPDRYSSRDELKYSLRAICKFLPWFRTIYIVSNCNPPDWLRTSHKIKWISHEEIFPDCSVLPTFNSHAIEACLHRITGLGDKFIYFNDDVLLNQPCYYKDFFDSQGRSIANLESYGMVFEDGIFDATREYLSSSLNSYRLINEVVSTYKAARLHRHTPHALKKEVLETLDNKFSEVFSKTRAARLRTPDDINVASFMYHHYALASGEAVCGDFLSLIVRPSNVSKVRDLSVRKYKFLCFNDGGGSAENDRFSTEFKRFVLRTYPMRNSFEM